MDQIIVDVLIRPTMPQVRIIAARMFNKINHTVELEDLVQAGMLGLIDAASKYDGKGGATFKTYADQRIRGAIVDSLRDNDWMPRDLRRELNDLKVTNKKLELELHRVPTNIEVSTALRITLNDLLDLIADTLISQVSFEELGLTEDGERFEDCYPDTRPDPLEILLERERWQQMTSAFDKLPPINRDMMQLYYKQDMQMSEIAIKLHLSKARISNLHTQSIEMMHRSVMGYAPRRKRAA